MSLNESKINRIKKDDKKIKTKSILNNFVYLVNLSEKINVYIWLKQENGPLIEIKNWDKLINGSTKEKGVEMTE